MVPGWLQHQESIETKVNPNPLQMGFQATRSCRILKRNLSKRLSLKALDSRMIRLIHQMLNALQKKLPLRYASSTMEVDKSVPGKPNSPSKNQNHNSSKKGESSSKTINLGQGDLAATRKGKDIVMEVVNTNPANPNNSSSKGKGKDIAKEVVNANPVNPDKPSSKGMNARVRNSSGKANHKKDKGKSVKDIIKETFKKKAGSNSGVKIATILLSIDEGLEDSNILEKLAALQCQKTVSDDLSKLGNPPTENPCLKNKESGMDLSSSPSPPSLSIASLTY